MIELSTRIFDPASTADIPPTAQLVEQQVTRADWLAQRTRLPSARTIQAFVDPGARVNAAEQLDTVARVWRVLGFIMPRPSVSQLQTMSGQAEDHPSYRILPARFLGRAGRAALDRVIPYRPQLFPGASGGRAPLSTRFDPLYVPDTSWRTYGQLLEQPDAAIQEGDSRYDLRYRTPSGALGTRMQFETELMFSGQTVLGTNDSLWSFPMVNLAERKPLPAASTVAELYESVSPWAIPESDIILGLLREMAGHTPDVPGGQLNLANEAVFTGGAPGTTGDLADVASVDWYPHFQEAAAYGAGVTNSAGNFRVAEAMSALAH